MPKSSPELSGSNSSVATTSFIKKPPPLPPRQMSCPPLPKPPALPDIEDVEDEESNESNQIVHKTSKPILDQGKMVASLSTLSSWSSTASVATRTNTDNTASMSHIVTNFNIKKRPKNENNEDMTPMKVFKQTPV